MKGEIYSRFGSIHTCERPYIRNALQCTGLYKFQCLLFIANTCYKCGVLPTDEKHIKNQPSH